MQFVTHPLPVQDDLVYSSTIHRAIDSSTALAPQHLMMQTNGSCQIDTSLYGRLPSLILIDTGSIFGHYSAKWAGYEFPPPDVLVQYALLYQGDEIGLDGSFYSDFDEYFTEAVQIHFGLGDDDMLNQEHMQIYGNLLHDGLEAVKAVIAVLLGYGVPIFGTVSCYDLLQEKDNVLYLKLKTQDELLSEFV